MTNIKFYSTLDRTVHLELWGASTKHPDCEFTYTAKERADEMCFESAWTKTFKWVLGIAGKMLWTSTAVDLMLMAKTMYEACIQVENPDCDMSRLYRFYEWA